MPPADKLGASSRICTGDVGSIESEVVQGAISAALSEIGCCEGFLLHALAGGRNNRVYRLDTEAGPSFALKAYFFHPDDRRDRLAAESSFSRLIWDGGLKKSPEIVAAIPEHRIAIFRFIDGRPVAPGQVKDEHVQAALDFVIETNALRATPDAAKIGPASDACFSNAAHIDCLKRRVAAIAALEGEQALYRDARRVTHERILPLANRIESQIRQSVAVSGFDLETEIPEGARCLSASDFGFHNTLLQDDGSLVFLDFEYAGWDDPAKLVGDFFGQEAVPVPLYHSARFADQLHEALGLDERHRRRTDIMLPLHRLKWICMTLQNFVPGVMVRRSYAERICDRENYLAQQLSRAEELLEQFDAI